MSGFLYLAQVRVATSYDSAPAVLSRNLFERAQPLPSQGSQKYPSVAPTNRPA